MVQGWLELRREHGKATRVYGVLKQRSLLVGPTALLDRSQPGTEEFFLEGAAAAVARNSPATGEFEMQVTLGSGEQLALRVDSEPVESNWIAWINVASDEKTWRETLTQLLAPTQEEKPKETPLPQSAYGKSKVGVLQEAEEWSEFSDNEQVMIEYMSRLVDAYLDTVRKNLLDSVPKVGMREG